MVARVDVQNMNIMGIEQTKKKIKRRRKCADHHPCQDDAENYRCWDSG